MNKLKESSLFLLIFFNYILLITILLYIFKITITPLHLPISFLLTSITFYILNKNKNIKDIFKIVFISLLVIIISILVSSFMFDRSSDGNTYHKDAVGVLKEGFNPIYESSSSIIEKRNDDSRELTNYSIWIDHYAKANWLIEANIYTLTNNIESAKAINLISIYIVFGFIFSTLTSILNKKKSFILALISVINPITASQLFTFYNDQLVCLYLFLSILFLIKLDYDIKDKESWLGYILTFIILANTKFNGLGYLLVFSFLFVCRYLYKAYKNKEFIYLFKKLCLIFIPLFIISIVIIGYPTYIKNMIDHNNMFFPLYDDNGEDIITAQQPEKFLKMNNLEKLFYGTFSKANNLRSNDDTTLKIPFTIYEDEIIPALSIDLRIGGWGLLFSGMLIISIFILIKYYKYYRKESFILYTLFITSILLVFMSESWWARYTPHFYLFIILSLYVLFKYNKHKYLNIIYTSIIILNTLFPLLGSNYYTFINSIKIRNNLLKLENKEIDININGMNGIIYNLKDYNISYNIVKEKLDTELYYHYLTYEEKEYE